MIQPKAQTQPSSYKTAKAGDFPDPPMASERRGPRRFRYGPGFAHLPILLGALMLLRLSPLSLQMAPANQIKTCISPQQGNGHGIAHAGRGPAHEGGRVDTHLHVRKCLYRPVLQHISFRCAQLSALRTSFLCNRQTLGNAGYLFSVCQSGPWP